MGIKVRIKQVILWSMVITLLFNTVTFAAVTTKSHEIKIDNAKSQIDQAATAQAIAYLMKKCVPVVTGYGGGNDSWDHNGWSNDIFLGSGETTDMSSGPWLEKEIQGKVDDGEVYCKNGGGVAEKQAILTLFSNLVGAGGPSYIMCNKENRGYPGLIALWRNDKRHNWDCDIYGVNGGGEYSYNTGVGDFTVYGQKYSNGEEYVRILYNHWVDSQNNPYLLHWDDDLSDFTVDGNEGARGYYIVRHDYEAQCGSKVVPKGTYGAVFIQDIDDKGQETKTYYEPTGDKKDSAVTNITGTRKRTCSQIADSLSGGYKTYFTEYRKALSEAFTKECKTAVSSTWEFAKKKADLILTSNPTPTEITNGSEKWRNYTEDSDGNKTLKEFTNEEKQDAKDLLTQYDTLKKKDYVTTGDDGWTCNAPDGYMVSMDDYQDPTAGVTEGGEVEPTCMNTAATSLGWILCPVLDAFGGATDWAYNELVKPALQIEPQLFTGGNEGTQRAWETFRSIANVFFIILFLVVIFSQLTGVGIDNYGIKKILPKLILAAVLINLSYLICIIFVDVSNILGNGLQNIFTDLGSQLSIPDSLEGGIGLSGVAQSTLTSIVVLIALIGGVATAITAAGGVVAFLVSLLIIALSALVALFFLFLLLAAREAAIIVLIVLSPLAFACYILPNTQNTFKKWYQLGWRLLMVYPIAGLLIGGGDFVSKLLLSAGVGGQGFFSAFAAIIAGIIPIFFIPTVLKQAFALMGGLGAKISGLGKSVGGRISGNVGKSIQGSERFKNYQADRERNRKLNFARRTNERLSRRNSETLSDRQRRQLASARMIESAEYAENLKRDAIVDGNRYEAMRAGIRAKDEDQAINDRLALMRSSGKSGGIMVGGQKVAYTLDNLNARMQELERKSRGAALSSDEQSEMAALARGMVSQKGGAGMLNNIVRNAGNQDATGKHQLNANFMSSLGQIYNNDSTVASKMTEKDGGMGGYMERFMPGGDGVNRNESFDDYFADNSNNGYAGNASRRIKSHEAGLNQSGKAFRYYLETLTKDQAQSIMDNQQLLNSLDVDNRTEFINYARDTLGVTGPSARDVNVINVPHTP